jgi:quinol monooxygenase YgiN
MTSSDAEGNVPEVWTLARWTVVPGREDEFVELWRELGERTLRDFPSARGTLLRDREQPNVFFSFGPWEDEAIVGRWRASPAFQAAQAGMRAMLESFEPHMLDPAATAGDGSPD